jgi:hypothetical protein
MTATPFNITAAALALFGVVGCIIGAIIDPAAFFRAWLCGYLFWLGVPLAGITLVLVHDLSGGNWMGSARPALNASIVTTPLASLAGIPAFMGINSLYEWTHPQASLPNLFYLNSTGFFVRYACYVVVWNLLAAFALWGPRVDRLPIRPALSWLSGVGLVALAFSTSFAAIDWILSLEPKFWSSIFPYTQAAGWFNTGMALVVLVVALAGWPADERRDQMDDLAKILLATTIFWAYLEFMQFLIIWEENLKTEIHWYVIRLNAAWRPAIYVFAILGFAIPFFVLLWARAKRSRAAVAVACISIWLSRVANTWLLVLPEFENGTPFWLDVAALLALGGGMLALFAWALPRRHRGPARFAIWRADHA